MADTLPDFEADFADWTDVYTTTGITVGNPVLITNKSSYEVLVYESATKPDASNKSGRFISTISTGSYQASITGTPTGLWVRSSSDKYKALVNVQGGLTMADTKPNITISHTDWVDAYSLSGISVGATVQAVNRSSIDVIYIISPTKPPVDTQDGVPLLPNEKVVIDDKPSGIWMKASGSYKAHVSFQHVGIRESNLSLAEKASADGTLRSGYDVVNIPSGDTYYWRLVTGSAPNQLALLRRFISSFEDSGVKYSVYDGVGRTLTPLAINPEIERFPSDAGIVWDRIKDPVPLPTVADRLDYTTIPKLGQGSSTSGGVEGFAGLRIQPNDHPFVLAAENLLNTTLEVKLELEWIKTDDPDYFR